MQITRSDVERHWPTAVTLVGAAVLLWGVSGYVGSQTTSRYSFLHERMQSSTSAGGFPLAARLEMVAGLVLVGTGLVNRRRS